MWYLIDYFTGEPQIVTNEDGSCMYFDTIRQAVDYGTEHLQKGKWKPDEQCM